MIRLTLLGLLALMHAKAESYRFGRVWDGGRVQRNVVIVVEKDRIARIGPSDGSAIDLTRYTALPGFIDVHTHLTYNFGRSPVAQSARAAAVVYLARENARKTLETGVTTVRDLGASNYNDIAMRDLIAAGLMAGPRMFVAGYGLLIPRGSTTRPASVRGEADIERAVREQIAAGADVIKMYGSTGSGQDVSGTQTFTFDEMKAAVDAAHAAGKKIAIHSYGPDGARDAVRAGADSVEHATDMDTETIAQMARRGIFYVPTIDHNRYYADNAEKLGFGAQAVENLRAYIARNLETARLAHKAGVRFAMGSDVVYTMFGENTRELGWFVKAGMSPEQALRAATVNGAELLGAGDRLGKLAPGFLADIVAVEGDPLADIDVAIHKIKWVMKSGAVVVDRR